MSATIEVLQGDCRDLLPTLPEQSVQTVVTSPPYWSLRDYGLPPSVWGGDSACEHVWGHSIRGPWANAQPGPGNPGFRPSTPLY